MLSERSECEELETSQLPFHFHDIAFSGLRYRLVGLTEEQGRSIQKRYNLPSGGSVSERIVVKIEYKPFISKSPELYTGIDGYEPLLDFYEDRVKVEGLDFKGTIQLQSKLTGAFFYNNKFDLASSTACENFLRMITSYALISSQGLLMHSAAVVVNAKAYLFIGRSNAGKTTISRLALTNGAEILSDDANVIHRSVDGTYLVDSVPFAGELGQQTSRAEGGYPLAGIYVLEKSNNNLVLPLNSAQKMASLLVSSPVVNMDSYRNKVLLDNIESLISRVSVARLQFTKALGFEDIYQCMTNPKEVAA